MPKLKVKPLEWYHQAPKVLLYEDGYRTLGPEEYRVGRDGYYCCGNDVWFEYEGEAYKAYPNATTHKAREYFCHSLTVNDEAILPQREVAAIKEVLKTSRDPSVRKALTKRLHLHADASSLRQCARGAVLARVRILGW